MLTYEDLVAVGKDEAKRMNFVRQVVSAHRRSRQYKAAVEAQAYYDGENPTIAKYEKILFDAAGKAHVDMWSANHKIYSTFFPMVIDQEVSYLLGNGVRFANDGTKDRLGADFDQDVMDLTTYARIGGAAYGFWNLDHIEAFKITEFAPLMGEETGALMAGVRWWRLDESKPMRYTLYEIDGYTEYIQRTGKGMEVYKPKRTYKVRVTTTQAEGTISADGENYPAFPVVPLYANKAHKSALCGKRNTIDALDLVRSNMINNVDEGNLIYWIIKGAGGMDELDDRKFIDRIKSIHVAHTEEGDEVEAHSIEAPFEGTQATVDTLLNQLYDDFQAFNSAAVTASNQSATAIQASYVPLDLKCDKIEAEVTRFVMGILKLAGIDDKPAYTRNQIINRMEETQVAIMQAQYFDEEYTRQRLMTINGDIDMFEEVSERIDAEAGKILTDLNEEEENG